MMKPMLVIFFEKSISTLDNTPKKFFSLIFQSYSCMKTFKRSPKRSAIAKATIAKADFIRKFKDKIWGEKWTNINFGSVKTSFINRDLHFL